MVFDLEDHATWEQVRDAMDRGVAVSKSALYDRYGLPEPADDEDSFLKQDGSIVTPPTGEPGVPLVSSDVQATALNGAQVASLIDLASQVAQKQLPIKTAKAIAKASFPLVKAEVIDEMFNQLDDIALADSNKKKARRLPLTLS